MQARMDRCILVSINAETRANRRSLKLPSVLRGDDRRRRKRTRGGGTSLRENDRA
jgi:hypothetical protein